MKLRRFLTYFARIQVDEPEKLNIQFELQHGMVLTVNLLRFDAETQTWTVELTAPPKAERPQ